VLVTRKSSELCVAHQLMILNEIYFVTTKKELKVPSNMGYKLTCLINLHINSE
jgi:hypothetical protein